MSTTAPLPPCPRWCRRDPSHGLPIPGGLRRVHLGVAVLVAGHGPVELEQVDTTRGHLVTSASPVEVVTDRCRLPLVELQRVTAGAA